MKLLNKYLIATMLCVAALTARGASTDYRGNAPEVRYVGLTNEIQIRTIQR